MSTKESNPLEWVELEVADDWGTKYLREKMPKNSMARRFEQEVKLKSRSVKCKLPDGKLVICRVVDKSAGEYVTDHGQLYGDYITSKYQALEITIGGLPIMLPWKGICVRRQDFKRV